MPTPRLDAAKGIIGGTLTSGCDHTPSLPPDPPPFAHLHMMAAAPALTQLSKGIQKVSRRSRASISALRLSTEGSAWSRGCERGHSGVASVLLRVPPCAHSHSSKQGRRSDWKTAAHQQVQQRRGLAMLAIQRQPVLPTHSA